MKLFNFLNESVEDKGILKAAFMAGSPGAGKSYTLSRIKSGNIEPRIVNTDSFYPMFKNDWTANWKGISSHVIKLTQNQLVKFLNSMLPLAIDGTSNSVSTMFQRIGILESVGYDVSAMVFVNTDLDVAIERANKRERRVDTKFIKQSYDNVQNAKEYYRSKFKMFIEIDNSEHNLDNDVVIKAFRKLTAYYSSPVENPIGKKIILNMREKKLKYLVPEIYTKEQLQRFVSNWYK